ncbi:TolC family outer membrane protein [Affinibrenneria salicis]|uniref:TolC family outer membrane protein n=1 Tax=Affinibrenneria salicis TaxID=2590031 RepID=A0A5J5FRT8_9GAMM|nr:TolC family outer membrane protein [Affinibrenneria salicis]KAA8995534.1 TolC family outer membrane protein [Affinibrenneria salicis]
MVQKKYLLPFLLSPIFAATVANAETLQDVVGKTLNSHPEVSASINSRYSAEKDLRAAKGGYLPSINLSAGTGREGTDNTTTRAAGTDHDSLHRSESSINMNQMVFDGFATSSEVSRQKATVNSRAYRVLNTSETTALSAIQAYMDVLQRQEFLRLAEANLASHERIYDQIRLRSEQGVGRLADLEQAEARLAQARNNMLTEQTNLEDAKTTYFSVTGTEPVDLTQPANLAPHLPATLDEARHIMVTNSPVLKSAEADVEAARQQYEASKSSYYPQVNVELARSVNDNVDGVRGHSNEWQAMVRMRYNLFDGGTPQANKESRAYLVKEAQDVRNNTLRMLNEELRLAWSALQNARQQVPVAEEYANRTMKVRTAYQKQFSLGERTLLDLLDSENEHFTAQRRLVEMRYTELFSGYRISARMGELLKVLSVPAPSASQALSQVKPQAELPDLK